ncbi:cytochrome P450 [Lactarius pseudohatsudake]|nr:cytochrome P450 [Lactarius pseudohatsudake]
MFNPYAHSFHEGLYVYGVLGDIQLVVSDPKDQALFEKKPEATLTHLAQRSFRRRLRGNLESIVSDGPQDINIADWIDRFALELLGEAGLGYLFGTLEGRNDEYCRALDEWMRMYEMKKRLLELGDGVEQVGDGKDIIGLLMRAMESEDDRLSKEELLAQMSAIVLAATDTTSSALSRILHLLALHPDIQDKLRKELKEACEDNGEINLFLYLA